MAITKGCYFKFQRIFFFFNLFMFLQNLPDIALVAQTLSKSDFFDLLSKETENFYSEEYEVLLQYSDQYFDTLLVYFKESPNREFAFRALSLASNVSSLDRIQEAITIIENIDNSEKSNFYIQINLSNQNIRNTIEDSITYRYDSEIVKRVVNNFGEVGFFLVTKLYRDTKSEFDKEVQSAKEAALISKIVMTGAALGSSKFLSAISDKSTAEIFADFILSPEGKMLQSGMNCLAEELQEEYTKKFFSLLSGIENCYVADKIPLIERQLCVAVNDEIIKGSLCKGWANIGIEAFPSIIINLTEKKLKDYAARTLYLMKPKDAIPMVLEELSNENSDVVYYCVAALGEWQAKETLPQIQPLLKHKERKVRSIAKNTISKLESD